MSVVSINHIWLDERNVAWIDQTNMKVIEIALERLITAILYSPEYQTF